VKEMLECCALIQRSVSRSSMPLEIPSTSLDN
jgi:hypothetical protein